MIRSVRAQVAGGVLRIYIDTEGVAQFNAFALNGPHRIVVDLRGVRNAVANNTVSANSRLAERVRSVSPIRQPCVSCWI